MDNREDPPMKKAKPIVASSVPAKRSLSGSSASASASSSAQRVAPPPEERRVVSENMWMPQSEKLNWLQSRFIEGADPRAIFQSLSSSRSHGGRSSRFQNISDMIPPQVSQELLWRVMFLSRLAQFSKYLTDFSQFLFELFTEPTPRQKLPNINTLDDVVTLIRNSRKILVVAGAGLSVSCGIPDFRSKDGLYAKVAAEFPQLRDPQSIFDAEFFKEDPRPFFRFAKNIFVPVTGGELHYKPSPSHRFIRELEKQGKLLRIYTQNIDGLETAAGISHDRVIACHGSFETSTCTECGRKVDSTEIADHFNNGTVAYCSATPSSQAKTCPGVLKPDIVFFGESLPSVFHYRMTSDKQQADLLIVVGSSMRVRPVSLIPFALSPSVPQILINRERLRHMTFDVELLGDSDVVVRHLRKKLAWNDDSGTLTGEKSAELPSFAYYTPNTYVFASSTNNAGASSSNPLVLSSEEPSDDSDWSGTSCSSSSSSQSSASSRSSSSSPKDKSESSKNDKMQETPNESDNSPK